MHASAKLLIAWLRRLGFAATLTLWPLPLMQAQAAASAGQTPLLITLADAIHRAEANEPTLAAARADQETAALDAGIARSTLLPSVVYHNQVLYTQPNGEMNKAGQIGSQAAPVFIANNAVREYASQASINETIGFAQTANVQVADAARARATAVLEVARRGVVAATASLFYAQLADDRRLVVLTDALNEARAFLKLTQQRESAREAAHADVLRAELVVQGRERDLAEGQLACARARLELGVLLFADPTTAYALAADATPALDSFADVEAQARAHNPELAAALATLHQSNAEVFAAKAAYLPDLGLNFTYGIDAPQFARNGPDNTRNLGYSMTATLDIPVWDWFATERRVKQGEARRDAADVALTAAQKRLVADLQGSYDEATTAKSELASLENTVTTAQESLRLAKLRYSSGEALVLEVTDAETTLTAAEIAEEDGQVRVEQALTGLQILVGAL